MKILITIFITGLVFYNLGYVIAHHTIKTECERLGRFFVGKKVFYCSEIEDVSDHISSL